MISCQSSILCIQGYYHHSSEDYCCKLLTEMGCNICFIPSYGGHHRRDNTRPDLEGASLQNIKNFSYNELRVATECFSQRNKIGRGGFGTVYKGVLKNGRAVALKVLSAESKQGVREFLTEIDTISSVKHPNLVELIGCCIEGTLRILVYEYLENKSIDRALLGANKRMDWRRRASICVGSAKGLAYLHEEVEPRIVHRDIKASNILLDKDFMPKIGDFGLAKLFPDNITHITTKIAGTTGYLAPEYALGGHLTMKADVYSFGVLILEVVNGRNSARSKWQGSQKFLLEWVWELYEEKKLLELVDPGLEAYPEQEVIKYIKVALFCTQENPKRRPQMSQVVDMLSRDVRLKEKELTAPGFFQDSGSLSSSSNKKFPDSSTSYQMSSVPSSITQVSPR